MLYAIRYWEDGEEQYEVFQQRKRFMDLVLRLDAEGIYWEWIK